MSDGAEVYSQIVRVEKTVHRQIKQEAVRLGIPVQELVSKILQEYFQDKQINN